MMSVRQQGVALLQALLLAMIVSLLALQLSLTAREQIVTARMLEDRLEADLLAHSLEVEALFNLMTIENKAPSFRGIWQANAETRAGRQSLAAGEGVTVELSDLSGYLPVRLPQHPLWQLTLERLGMSRDDARAFLSELGDMQDEDLVDTSMSAESPIGGAGIAYPNRFIQLPTELERWMGYWGGWMPVISEVSHHYPLYEVNQGALAQTLAAVTAKAPSAQISVPLPSNLAAPPLLVSPGNELISRTSSTYWRVEVTVDRGLVTRRVRSDFLLQSLDEPPFLWVGR
jgi:hypothetical protein